MLVSPQRTQRPWLGQVEAEDGTQLAAYDPSCYLCPGNERAGGVSNPEYSGTFVFENDFPALLPPASAKPSQAEAPASHSLFSATIETGVCRVVCFSPRHDLSLPELPQPAVEQLVRTWMQQTRELAELPFTSYVQVFENKGAMMGASNPHPHSQVWASSHVPVEPAKELACQQSYAHQHDRCLLCDTQAAETASGERLVLQNEHFLAVVPFWAVWPFETLVISKRHTGSLPDLTREEVWGLADLLRRLTARYDNLFQVSFPYSMGFHQSPVDGKPYPIGHLHAHFYPPLLRSATVRKFMVGYEMLAMPQRDITPEAAAERLRQMSDVHYKKV